MKKKGIILKKKEEKEKEIEIHKFDEDKKNPIDNKVFKQIKNEFENEFYDEEKRIISVKFPSKGLTLKKDEDLKCKTNKTEGIYYNFKNKILELEKKNKIKDKQIDELKKKNRIYESEKNEIEITFLDKKLKKEFTKKKEINKEDILKTIMDFIYNEEFIKSKILKTIKVNGKELNIGKKEDNNESVNTYPIKKEETVCTSNQ